MSKRLRESTEIISGVYEIVNVKNDHRYVGSSKDIYGRWVQHKNELKKNKHCNQHLQRAWNKYGEESFEFSILEVVPDMQKERFIREQYWYDFYKNNGITLYNEADVAIAVFHNTTIDELKNGERTTSYEQFVQICDLLQNTSLPFYQIADLSHTYTNQVYCIYNRTYFADITKDMVFQIRSNKGENSVKAKLTESDVFDIIQKMINGAYTRDLSREYGVSASTINDIRHHRCWCELTDGIVFPTPKATGNVGKCVLQYDLNGNFIAEYANAREAEKCTGIGYKLISRVCLGQRKQACGFIFKFKTKQNE